MYVKYVVMLSKDAKILDKVPFVLYTDFNKKIVGRKNNPKIHLKQK